MYLLLYIIIQSTPG